MASSQEEINNEEQLRFDEAETLILDSIGDRHLITDINIPIHLLG